MADSIWDDNAYIERAVPLVVRQHETELAFEELLSELSNSCRVEMVRLHSRKFFDALRREGKGTV
jgi:hypothetical protein